MKKLIPSIFLLLLVFTLSLNKVKAQQGSFKLLDFPNSITMNGGDDSSVAINFVYSGLYPNNLGVSLVGNQLPGGIKLSSIRYDVNGVDSIYLSGVPNQVGNFPLTLLLTDNSGVSLTQDFNIKVNGIVFTDGPLQHAIINEPYHLNLNYYYTGSGTPELILSDISDGLYFQYTGINSPDKKTFSINTFTPRKLGTLTFKGDAVVNGVNLASKIFTLVVDNVDTNTSINVPNIPSPTSNITVAPTPIPPVAATVDTKAKVNTTTKATIKSTTSTNQSTTTKKNTIVATNKDNTKTNIIPVDTSVKTDVSPSPAIDQSTQLTPKTNVRQPWYLRFFNFFKSLF